MYSVSCIPCNEAPRSKLRGITELNSEDFSEGEANPVASYGECQVQWDKPSRSCTGSLCMPPYLLTFTLPFISRLSGGATTVV